MLKSKGFNFFLRAVVRAWTKIDRGIGSRLLGRIRVSGTVNLFFEGYTFKMFAKWDDGYVDKLYFPAKEYSESAELKLFVTLAKDSQVILDIGANTGMYSVVSSKANPKAIIKAFEPYDVNAGRLRTNLELNGAVEQVEIIQKALGAETRTIQFAVPDGGQICDVSSADVEFTKKHYQKWLTYKEVETEQLTLDEFCESSELDRLDLIKLDVENHELNVLKGGLKSLDRYKPIIQVEIFVDEERRKFYEESLRPLGYQCYLILKEGLVRTETLVENPDCGNFILAKSKSEDQYLSFSEMNKILAQLR